MERLKLFSLLISLVLSMSFSLSAQQKIGSVIHTAHKINSVALNEERTILVRTPPDYNKSTTSYPVIIMLDAHGALNTMLPSVVESQASYAEKIPEMIVVGIQNTNRTRDMTPSQTERRDSGGADKFLDFIQSEVIPFVDKNYRTHPYRVFAGHSLAGLTVVYTLAARPHLFNGYIAASPVLHWDKNFVIKKSAETFKNRKDLKNTLFVSLGNEPDYDDGFNSYNNLLQRSAPKGLSYELNRWLDEDHGSGVMRAFLFGLRKIFDGWPPPPSIGNVGALEKHYQNLSKRFGYEITTPEASVNGLGYSFLVADRVSDAIATFERNVELYPNSANVYDSLAEAQEKAGLKSKALANFEKAYKMAEKSGDVSLAQSAKANFERLRK